MSERGQFVTRLGAIAAAVGSAVGLGNICKFPCEAGSNGGGAFLLIYLACVVLLGIPVMVAEFVIGRSTRSNVSGALKQLAPRINLRFLPWLWIVASLMILSFYSVICGWIVEYLTQAVAGTLQTMPDGGNYHERFSLYISNPWRNTIWTIVFLLVNALVLMGGVKKGIERVANVMMPLLFLILIIFAVNSLLMPRSGEGLRFLFSPDFSKVTPRMVIDAMGQAFFSLSLGLSCLLTYASYFKKEDRLVRNATVIALLDTLVAVLAGIVIFPAVFTYGLRPEAGMTLLFEVMPSIFNQMAGGYIWSILFFVLLFFASLTSTISMSEISITFFTEEYGMSRRRAVVINTAVAIVFGVLCGLSFSVLRDVTLFEMTLFDLFDYVSSNLLLPLGGIFFSIFIGWVVDKHLVARELTNDGTVTPRVHHAIIFLLRWVAPLAITLVFVYGIFFN